MELDKKTYGTYKPELPNLKHDGYCPIINGEAVGRYRYFSVAEAVPAHKIVQYRDLEKFGYKQTEKNWKEEHNARRR